MGFYAISMEHLEEKPILAGASVGGITAVTPRLQRQGLEVVDDSTGSNFGSKSLGTR
jgi:hypothetical protein